MSQETKPTQAAAFTHMAAQLAHYFHELIKMGMTREEAFDLTVQMQSDIMFNNSQAGTSGGSGG